MKTKTAYRLPSKNIPAEAPHVPEEPIQPSESVRINFDTDKAEPAVAVVSADEYPEPDEATLTLQNQITHLKKSEELQKQYALHVAAQRAAQMAAPEPALPEGRAERIALWRQHGLSDDDATFLEARPAMIDHPQITRQAVAAAEHAGLERGSDDFNTAVENNFNTLMQRAEAQATPAATPEFFRPPPEPSRSPASDSARYSAPVSRTVPGYRESSPRMVKLSPAEQQIAAASGISDIEYAKNKMRMLRERAAGERD